MIDTDANKAAAREYLTRGLRNTRHVMAMRQGGTARFMHGDEAHVGIVTQVAREQFTYVSALTGKEHTFLLDEVDGFAYEKLLIIPGEITEYMLTKRGNPAFQVIGDNA